jgi:hypothetical protein
VRVADRAERQPDRLESASGLLLDDRGEGRRRALAAVERDRIAFADQPGDDAERREPCKEQRGKAELEESDEQGSRLDTA